MAEVQKPIGHAWKSVNGKWWFSSRETDAPVFLRPDPNADKLRARIRVLEAEFTNGYEILGGPNGDTLNERIKGLVEAYGKLETEFAEYQAEMSDELHTAEHDCAVARNELAAESAKVGQLQTELDGSRNPEAPEAQQANAWKAVWEELRDLDKPLRKESGADTAVRLIREMRRKIGLLQSRHASPLPAEVSGWKWEGPREDRDDRAQCGDWTVEVSHWSGTLMRWVYYQGKVVDARSCRTVSGGKRLAVAAARRAWRIRNEAKP